jgi:hypothetical protein
MADTTVTAGNFDDCSRMISITRVMDSALPIDDPPNFMTSGFLCGMTLLHLRGDPVLTLKSKRRSYHGRAGVRSGKLQNLEK